MLAEGTEGGTRICQQYGAFLANADDLAGPASPILLAAALWQTRWSQAFELARALENLSNPGGWTGCGPGGSGSARAGCRG